MKTQNTLSALIASPVILFFFATFLFDNQLVGQSFAECNRPGISYQFSAISDPGDSVKVEKLHSPRKATIMSAVCPGLGQIYNKKYWKLAIIYPAMGGLTYGFLWNHSYFKVYRDALRIRYDGDSTTIDQFSLYSDDRIVTMKNYYQRYRDLCVIGFAAVYVLQVIDAAVDAHLYNFDVGPDLSFRWGPIFNSTAAGPSFQVGMSLSYR